jgi:hypothetical protein
MPTNDAKNITSPKMQQFLQRQKEAQDRRNKLLENIKSNEPRIATLLTRFEELEPDLVYRFYHQSFKVFIGVSMIEQARDLFLQLAPPTATLNGCFLSITDLATSKEFGDRTNEIWREETQPILEAFWHSKYFLTQMVISARELETEPEMMPSGWAAILYLYNLRY